jgi:lipid A 4'-phosphatase
MMMLPYNLQRYTLYALIAAMVIAIVITFIAPQIDLMVSSFFYNKLHGFELCRHRLVLLIYNSVPILVVISSCALILNIIKPWYFTRVQSWYLILCLVIGPGLVVNVIFKEHSGRPRPKHIIEFGGSNTFRPLLDFNGQCSSNCSFSCGHAAMGFYITAFAFTQSNERKRNNILYVGILLGYIIGIARLMQGGHFFSDVICSGLIVMLINYFLSKVMLNR